jgi:hypothetical protein
MTRINEDRGLLYGILALQNGFIDRGTLVDALEVWALETAQPLGRILRERGSLTPEEESLLDALVARHLARHGDDPERSLADLDPAGSVREILGRLAETAPTAEPLVAETRVHERVVDILPSGQGRAVGRSSASGSRFRIVRAHARGGLGEVYPLSTMS